MKLSQKKLYFLICYLFYKRMIFTSICGFLYLGFNVFIKIYSKFRPLITKKITNCLVYVIFSYNLFISWKNETKRTSKCRYRASHRKESIKTKQENKLLSIASGYILFTSSFDSFYLLLWFRDRLQIWCFDLLYATRSISLSLLRIYFWVLATFFLFC